MLDFARLWQLLGALGLVAWRDTLEPLLAARLQESAHGDYPAWQHAVEGLGSAPDAATRKELLLALAPWRKGPFDVGGVHIDSEWRSNLKWQRVLPALAPLQGRRVLDVGCGNGYYALQLRAAGAAAVIGVDPTLLYVMQFLAVQRFVAADDVFVLPLRLHELPLPAQAFDTTLSMGVLYHQRSPIDHLRQLRDTLRPGGELVLETLFLPGEEPRAFTPPGRYARMRNVWLLPTLSELTTWLERCGYRDVRIADTCVTTVEEQRSTEWMPFESLREALDPADPGRTIEGHPAPRRVIVVANSP